MSTPPTPTRRPRERSSPWTETTLDDGSGTPLRVRIHDTLADRAVGALVVHFHGGSFIAGDLDSGLAMARLLQSAGATVVSVDYPLAPDRPFPAAVESGYAALLWAYRQRSRLAGRDARLFVAGEEAGGNLAAALAMVCRDRHRPVLDGQLLVSPMLDARVGTASMREGHAGASGCRWARGWCAYLGCGAGAEHPYAMPARAERLSGLPPTQILTAEDDPLRDEALAYAQGLEQAGVEVRRAVLAAPTGWPCSLGAPDTGAWGETMHHHLTEFLAPGVQISRPACS
ncbi:MAG: alpha/beta hydrolase [Rhodocyclaceae bacterium]|nr:alpha/beta hydrolase [Rhodocyclaceae bacterium]